MLHRWATIIAATLFALFLGQGSAWACTVPNFFVNSTIADADTVNANFTAVLACVNVNSVVGPNSSVNGGGVCWNNTTGSLVKDCSIAFIQGSPANPSGTISTAPVMMGTGGTCAFTPRRSGKVMLIISGDAANSIGGQGFSYQIWYGTGGAPANGAAATGTAASGLAPNTPPSGIAVPFSTQGVVTGLTLNTPYWFDLGLLAFLGGTASVTNISCSALESRLDFRHSPRWRNDPANDNSYQLGDSRYAA